MGTSDVPSETAVYLKRVAMACLVFVVMNAALYGSWWLGL